MMLTAIDMSRHSRESALLSGENEVLQKCAGVAPRIENFPWKFSVPSARHSSESWNPVPLQIFKSLDSSFRWNDVVLAFPQERRKISQDNSARKRDPFLSVHQSKMDSRLRGNDGHGAYGISNA
jgi:hypothetical protein